MSAIFESDTRDASTRWGAAAAGGAAGGRKDRHYRSAIARSSQRISSGSSGRSTCRPATTVSQTTDARPLHGFQVQSRGRSCRNQSTRAAAQGGLARTAAAHATVPICAMLASSGPAAATVLASRATRAMSAAPDSPPGARTATACRLWAASRSGSTGTRSSTAERCLSRGEAACHPRRVSAGSASEQARDLGAKTTGHARGSAEPPIDRLPRGR